MIEQNNILEVHDLTKYFPWGRSFFGAKGLLRAVDQVSFQIKTGETFALVGESGCGKSTTGRLILDLEHPTSGEILYKQTPLTELLKKDWRLFRQEVQVVFQDSHASLNPRKTIRQLLLTALFCSGKIPRNQKQKALERSEELLTQVGLTPAKRFFDRYPHQLSGGQRQRVGIARALCTEPGLIVADEPVSALDVSVRAQVLKLLKTLQEEERVTYLFISHDLAVVRSIAHTVGVMYLGRLMEYGPVESVFSKKTHPYTEALISATPLPDPRSAHNRKRIILKGSVPSPANPPSGCSFHTRCPQKIDICSEKVPKMTEVDAGHSVFCHLALERFAKT